MQTDQKHAIRKGTHGVEHSGWTTFPGERATFEPLLGDRSADVVVVGAGLAGSSVALHLAQGGAGVALLEAHEPGWGASGRNAGHVVTHREVLPSLRRLPDRGEAFIDLWRRELNLTYTLVQQHRINCDAVQGGYLKVALTARAVAGAQRHAEEFAALGLPVRFADRDEVAVFTGSDRYHGGALDEAGGRINPFHFARGLARAAREAGAAVYSRSPVDSARRGGTKWRVRTPGGSVMADRLVFCTGAYGDVPDIPEIRDSWCPLLAYAIMTKPLPERARSRVLPTGGVCSELPGGMNPALIDGLGRLVTASIPLRRAENYTVVEAMRRRWIDRTYPELRGVSIETAHYWTGALAWSKDQLPQLLQLGPGAFMVNGFSAEGNVPAPMLGKHFAEKLLADALGELALPLRPAQSLRWRGRYEFSIRKVLIPLHVLAERVGMV
jgi:glycine/D-amino acid oxidase-like deaminating enzyme